MAFYRCTQCGGIFEVADGKTSCYCSNCGAHQLLAPTDASARQGDVHQRSNQKAEEIAPQENMPVQQNNGQPDGQQAQPQAAVWQQSQQKPKREYHPPIGKGAVPYPDASQSIQPKIGMNKGLLFGLILGGIVLLIGIVVTVAVFATRAEHLVQPQELSGGIYDDEDDDIDYGAYRSYLFGEGYVSSSSDSAVSSSSDEDNEVKHSDFTVTVPEKHTICAGGSHTVAIKDGKALATGDNEEGQCDVSGWSDIVTVSAGYEHTLGVKADGTVVAAGDNVFDQCEVSGWEDVVDVAAGTFHSLGLKKDGTVLAAGDNDDGQCNVDSWSNITAIAAGYHHSVGLRADGTVVAAGSNEDGQCNVDSWKDIVAIAVGDVHTVGLKADGTVVVTGKSFADASEFAAMKNVVAISAGCSHTVALKKDGTVTAVGYSYDGRCDTGSWVNVTQIAAGGYYSIGLKDDGTLYAVGDNEENQCDVGSWDIK